MATVAPVTSGNLLGIVLDMDARRVIGSLTSTAPRIGGFVFARGDTVKGTIRTVTPSGSTTPLYWTVNIPTYEIAVTNGINVVYSRATGWEALGGSDNPHQAFDLDLTSPELDFALQQTPNVSIPAVMEIHISGFPVSEGSAYPQDQYIVRETAIIYKSGLNPLL